MRVLNVIIGCEFSGVVRRAFRERGHNAYSCDLLRADDCSPHHIQADHDLHLLDLCSSKEWDLGIFHPPCTYLCNSGVRWLYGGPGRTKDPMRWSEMVRARAFFLSLLNCGIPRVCVENPIPHRHADLPRYSQIIQPFEHGHGETKATALWLKGLPLLEYR